jgi:DNA-binding SARP family transcriptional activator
MLAVAGELGITRDKIAGSLWGEMSEGRARSLLKQLLYLIRKEISEPELIAGSMTLRLNPAVCDSDIADWRASLQAGRVDDVLALYRGPLLDGVYLDDNPAFQRWVEIEQSRLANRMQTMIRRSAASMDTLGKYSEAVELWSALVEQEPLSDINELGLVRALVAAGDRAAAARHVKAYTALVWRELETEPAPEIGQVLRTVRRAV